MKALVGLGWVAAGVVIGFMLGGIPAARERQADQERIAELERSLRRVDRPNVLDNFLPRFGAGSAPEAAPPPAAVVQADAAEPGHADGPDVDRADPTPPGQGSVAVIGTPAQRPRRGLFGRWRDRRRDDRGDNPVPVASADDPRGRDSDDRRASDRGGALQRFDQIASVQRARAAASRIALIEQAGLDEEQVAQVDATVERMNGELTGYGEEMIEQMVADEPPAPAQALGLGHDVSGILFEGQKELDSILGEAAQDVDPSALEVWNYVDIEQWRPMVEKRLADRPAPGREAPAAPPEGGAGSGAQEPETE